MSNTIPNYEQLQKLYDELNSKGGGENFSENFLKVEEGKPAFIRILPAKDADNTSWYSKTIRFAFKLGDKFKYLQSPKIVGEECLLHNMYYELWDEHDSFCKSNSLDPKKIQTPYKTWAQALKPKECFFLNVVDRREEGKVKLLSCTEALMKIIVGAMFKTDIAGELEYGDITNLKTGHDFTIDLSRGENKFLNYNKSAPSPKSKPAGKAEQIALWMDSLHDLNVLVKPASSEEITEAINQIRKKVDDESEKFIKEMSGSTEPSRTSKLTAAMGGESNG